MTRAVCAAIAAAAVIASAASSPAGATTVPGVLYVKPLVITNDRIVVGRNRSTGVQRYPRGVEVRYEVRNLGTHRFRLDILGSSTGMLAPGRRSPILVGWNHRGRFTFRARPSGPSMRVWVY